MNKIMSKPTVALLLYGTLNTHNHINASESRYATIGKVLLQLASDDQINLAVYVYTEDKGFFKNTPKEYFDEDRVHGYTIIDWVESRYCVAQIDKMTIEDELAKVYGDHLKGVRVEVENYDRDAWSSSNEDYRRAETSNRWRNTMITTFFFKKKKAFELATCREGALDGAANAVYVLARPDSHIVAHPGRVRSLPGLEPELVNGVMKEIVHASRSDDRTVFYDRPNVHTLSLYQDPSCGMLKNDLMMARYPAMKYNTGMYDVIRDAGNFFDVYTDQVYRCRKCYYLNRREGVQRCELCFGDDLEMVTEWPEFKMFEHLSRGGYTLRELTTKGFVVR